MSGQEIRIIETGLPLGGRLAHVYVFCLSAELNNRREEVIKAFQSKLAGAVQFVRDDAGVLVYADEKSDTTKLCEDGTRIINQVLKTNFVFKTAFFVNNYRMPGGKTFNQLMQNPKFALSYLRGL